MKSLVVHSNKCVGCRNCVYICSFEHEDFFDPELSRIQIFYGEEGQLFIPNYCLQCGKDAACIKSCPSGALFFEENLNAVLWRAEICIHCHQCILICPFHAITSDGLTDAILKCDLCFGNPKCVLVCPENALEYVEMDEKAKDDLSDHAQIVQNFLKTD